MSLKLRRQREWLQKRIRQPKGEFPLGTLAWYGPDDRRASKAVAAVLLDDDSEPVALERWWQSAFDIRDDDEVLGEVVDFFRDNQVRRVVTLDRIFGCPHEEGEEYPEGGVCPECTFWARRDRFTGEPIEVAQAGGESAPGDRVDRADTGASVPDPRPELVDSPLSREITVTGHCLRVEIYGSRPDEWYLEVVNEAGTSTVWDEPFPTDQAAWATLMETIEAEGVAALVEDVDDDAEDGAAQGAGRAAPGG